MTCLSGDKLDKTYTAIGPLHVLFSSLVRWMQILKYNYSCITKNPCLYVRKIVTRHKFISLSLRHLIRKFNEIV